MLQQVAFCDIFRSTCAGMCEHISAEVCSAVQLDSAAATGPPMGQNAFALSPRSAIGLQDHPAPSTCPQQPCMPTLARLSCSAHLEAGVDGGYGLGKAVGPLVLFWPNPGCPPGQHRLQQHMRTRRGHPQYPHYLPDPAQPHRKIHNVTSPSFLHRV